MELPKIRIEQEWDDEELVLTISYAFEIDEREYIQQRRLDNNRSKTIDESEIAYQIGKMFLEIYNNMVVDDPYQKESL